MSSEQNRAGQEGAGSRMSVVRGKTTPRIWSNLFWAAVVAAVAVLALFHFTQAVSPAQKPTATPSTTINCTVQANRLNLRAGPGTNYRSDALLDKGTTLRATGRNSASTWIKVTVRSTGKEGWVAYGNQYAACASAISRLAVATAPPATGANAASTNTGSSNTGTGGTALPPPIALVVLPVGGGGADDLQGNLVTNETVARYIRNPFADGPNDPDSPDYIVLSDRLGLALDFTRRPNSGPISHLDVYVNNNETGDIVWELTIDDVDDLSDDPICFFGGAPGDCNSIDLRPGATWPDWGTPIENGQYDLQMSAENTPDDENGNGSSRNWNATIIIDSPRLRATNSSTGSNTGDTTGTPTPPPPAADEEPVIQLIEAGPGSTNADVFDGLTAQVAAWDANAGTENGDGIAWLYMDLTDPNGVTVAEVTWESPAYCLFGEGGDGCIPWWFADSGYTWPDGTPIEPGAYTLYVDAVGTDGGESEATFDLFVN